MQRSFVSWMFEVPAFEDAAIRLDLSPALAHEGTGAG
jgi:hypothetical protein